MIKVISIPLGVLQANTHIVYDDQTKKALIIDLGADFSKIQSVLSIHNLKAQALLLTHGHFDHTLGASSANKKGLKVYISKNDSQMLTDTSENLSYHFGVSFEALNEFETLFEGDYEIGGFSVKVIETKGHTKGSCCFIIGDYLFSGDTLFKDSFGRYDFEGGSFIELKTSLNKLFALKNYQVFTGHGENTTIQYEKENNPILCY